MPPMVHLPGPDWTTKLVKGARQNNNHWITPIRRIEFKRYKKACEFEKLRKIYENDEVRAWNEFRRIVGKNTCVVSPFQYDEPGPNWIFKLVKDCGQNRSHWISPIRRIEFKRYKQACIFEDLRRKCDNDEVVAWNEFRRIVGKNTCVVAPYEYDEIQQQSRRKMTPICDRCEDRDVEDGDVVEHSAPTDSSGQGQRVDGARRPPPSREDLLRSPSSDVVSKDESADQCKRRKMVLGGSLAGRPPPKFVALAATATQTLVENYDEEIRGGGTTKAKSPPLSPPKGVGDNYDDGLKVENVNSAEGGVFGLDEERATGRESSIYSSFFDSYWEMIDK
jgi:hypothetical protein